MTRRIAKHVLLHSLFMVAAMATYPFGVLLFGLPFGDNPGTLGAGVLTFLICYLGFVGMEALVRNRFLGHLRQRKLALALTVAAIALGKVILSVLAIDFAAQLAIFGGSIPEGGEKRVRMLALFAIMVIALELVFLALFKGIQRGAALISARIWPAAASTPS